MQGFNTRGKGYVVADPELKFGQTTGKPYVNFRIAANRGKYKDETKKEWLTTDTTYMNVRLFGPSAEAAATQLKKGSQVFIEGEINTDSWSLRDENGVDIKDEKGQVKKGYKQVIYANSFIKLTDPKTLVEAEQHEEETPVEVPEHATV